MSITKCPECNSAEISSSAKICPKYGYPLVDAGSHKSSFKNDIGFYMLIVGVTILLTHTVLSDFAPALGVFCLLVGIIAFMWSRGMD